MKFARRKDCKNCVVEATYAGRDKHGHHLLQDVIQDGEALDHRWLNGERANFPEGIEPGSRIRFIASPLHRHGGIRLTDVREVKVLVARQQAICAGD